MKGVSAGPPFFKYLLETGKGEKCLEQFGKQKKTKRKIERREKKSLVVFADATLLKDVEPLQAGLVSSFGKSRQT